MVSSLAKLAAVIAAFPAVFAAPTAAPFHLKIRNPTERDVIPGSYIVVYNNDVNSTFRATLTEGFHSLLSKRDGSGIGAEWDLSELKGFQVIADEATIADIANSPDVAYVEKDGVVRAAALTTQTGSTYGLGRISHRDRGTTSYIYDTTAGSGSTIYIVDTGILIGHSQFEGRASWGANFVDSSNTDGNGHGTHCAGTAAGVTYGVAKKANLVAVKVLDASGSGSNSGVISGIQWVGNNAPARSVLSMSLAGSTSSAVNSAVRSVYAQGVTVVVAAGNNNQDASTLSPASEPLAITVAAIDSTDTRASFSNYGSLVDVFAPGVNVLSSWIGSNTATNTISGTSMACPHVAGLAAYLISLEGLTTPAAVANRIVALSTTGKVVSPGTNSPNRIAYNGNGA